MESVDANSVSDRESYAENQHNMPVEPERQWLRPCKFEDGGKSYAESSNL
jgi:hypothetical protein